MMTKIDEKELMVYEISFEGLVIYSMWIEWLLYCKFWESSSERFFGKLQKAASVIEVTQLFQKFMDSENFNVSKKVLKIPIFV